MRQYSRRKRDERASGGRRNRLPSASGAGVAESHPHYHMRPDNDAAMALWCCIGSQGAIGSASRGRRPTYVGHSRICSRQHLSALPIDAGKACACSRAMLASRVAYARPAPLAVSRLGEPVARRGARRPGRRAQSRGARADRRPAWSAERTGRPSPAVAR